MVFGAFSVKLFRTDTEYTVSVLFRYESKVNNCFAFRLLHLDNRGNYYRYETNVRRIDHSSDPTTTTSTSGSSSPTTSSSDSRTPKKRVQFSQDVKDNELTSHRLIYDKLPMASPPRKPPVVIDITKLNAEQGFGFNRYLTTDSKGGDYRQQIFESPYFDYRKTHSRVRNSARKFKFRNYILNPFDT